MTMKCQECGITVADPTAHEHNHHDGAQTCWPDVCVRCEHSRTWHRGYWAECELNGPQPKDGCECPQFVEAAA